MYVAGFWKAYQIFTQACIASWLFDFITPANNHMHLHTSHAQCDCQAYLTSYSLLYCSRVNFADSHG